MKMLYKEKDELRADQDKEAEELISLLDFVSGLPDGSVEDLKINAKFPGPSVKVWARTKQQQSAGGPVTCTHHAQASAGSKPLQANDDVQCQLQCMQSGQVQWQQVRTDSLMITNCSSRTAVCAGCRALHMCTW